VQIFGAKDYAMRIWVRPDRLTQLRLTPTDLIRALNEQNAQFAAGKVGQSPSAGPQELVYTITTKGRLADPREFENIIVRANPDGGIEPAPEGRGARRARFQGLRVVGRMNGQQATLVGIFLLPRANALEVADNVVKTVNEIVPRFPPGMVYSVPYDTTRFVRVSIREVLFHAGRSDAARHPGGVPVPAELARDPDPGRRGAGVADRLASPDCTCSATRSTR